MRDLNARVSLKTMRVQIIVFDNFETPVRLVLDSQ